MKAGITVEQLADKFVTVLEESGKWLTRKDMSARNWSSRECRLAREHSNGRAIFGQKGYKATKHATQGEIDACMRALMGMAKKMIVEADAIAKARGWERDAPKQDGELSPERNGAGVEPQPQEKPQEESQKQ
jgi:hypothetical protein